MRRRALPNIRVSPQDRALLASSAWYVTSTGYIRRMSTDSSEKVHCEYLHRLIMQPPPGMTVDHINGDKSDNRRWNLRVCSHKNNCRAKAKLPGHNTTGYRGVSRYGARFRAMIRVDNKGLSLGLFNTAEAAARAYDVAAQYHFGSFASVNFDVR